MEESIRYLMKNQEKQLEEVPGEIKKTPNQSKISWA
jgi:hypothetical protein